MVLSKPHKAQPEVNLNRKPTASAANVQHGLRLGDDSLVKAKFGDRHQTKLGGAPLLLQLELSDRLVRGAADCLKDWRVSGAVKFSLYQQLWQRVLLICCGYEDAIDGAMLSHDPGLLLSLRVEGADLGPASQPTICRFENHMDSKNCYRMAVWLLFAYITEKKRPPKAIRLDLDGSSIETHGQQELSSYRAYYDTQMLFPLFVFDEDGVLITAILRPGEHGEAKLTVPILKRIITAFRTAWPLVEITIVMDAGFSDPAIYDWCEQQGKDNPANTVFYLIKLRNSGGAGSGLFSHSHELARLCKDSFGRRFGKALYLEQRKKKYVVTRCDVEKKIRHISNKKERKDAWQEYSRRICRRYGEFKYQAGKGGQDKKQWRKPRRILVECINDDWGARRTFWITNIAADQPNAEANADGSVTYTNFGADSPYQSIKLTRQSANSYKVGSLDDVVVKATHKAEEQALRLKVSRGDIPLCEITKCREEEQPTYLINETYSRRGNAELRIKDAKAFRCDKLSCQDFFANQFRLLMHVLAQRLLFSFRRLLPVSSHSLTLDSVREHFLCIPAIIEEKPRAFELIWSSTFPLKNHMHALCKRLTEALIVGHQENHFPLRLHECVRSPSAA